jgi:hypothetical protein
VLGETRPYREIGKIGKRGRWNLGEKGTNETSAVPYDFWIKSKLKRKLFLSMASSVFQCRDL